MNTANHAEAFRAAVKGHDAYTIALALNSFTPGSDWRGCTRTMMADSYADAMNGNHYNRACQSYLRSMPLVKLTARLEARKAGDKQWRTS